LLEQKTREALREQGDTLIAQLESGASVEDLDAGEWVEYTGQSRSVSGDLGRQLIATAFSLERPQEGGVTYGKTLSGNGIAIIALDQVNEGEITEGSGELSQLRQFLSSMEGQREYAAYQQYLREQAEVSRP